MEKPSVIDKVMEKLISKEQTEKGMVPGDTDGGGDLGGLGREVSACKWTMKSMIRVNIRPFF